VSRGDRLHALDAVRAFALLLGVVYHATLSFIPRAEAGRYAPVADVSPGLPLAVVAFTGHLFRMSLFFLMAGFFARMLVQRRGLRGFWADRLPRILAPLVVGWIVFFPLVSAAWSWGLSRRFYPSPLLSWPPSLDRFPLSYLWFLYYLLLLYALALCVRGAVLRVDHDGRLRRTADRLVRAATDRRWAGPGLLTVPLCAGLLTLNGWSVLDGIPTPNGSLLPQPLPVLAYGLAFALGWMLHRNADLLGRWRERWRGYLIAAAFATVLCMLIATFHAAQPAGASSPLPRLAFVAGYAFASWCWMFGLTGFALRFLSEPSAVRRYVADASYWIYLVHYPLVLALQDALAGARWHWVVKFPVIVLATLAVSLLTYHCLVRFTIIGRVLNGRRAARTRERPYAGALPMRAREIGGS
jgi:peptidoglycan/LPS O-acetylase OafA/YrhL